MSNKSFSKDQMLAINHFTGPALIVAGPGSGKTTVIVNRIKNLIYNKHIPPENILVITFSKMAAISMQARFFLSVEDAYMPVSFGTFHSVFYNIVRKSSPFNSQRIATTRIKNSILNKVLKNISYSENTEPEFIESIQKRISYYKNSDRTNDNSRLCPIPDDIFMKIYENYCDLMEYERYIDFEDMMLQCKELLLNNSDIREYYQQQFKFILIDEFQDINNLQYEIIRLLLGSDNNLFAVGDDDQSIYGFRGANPQIMQQFEKDFIESTVIKLSCNYRSTKSIIDAAKMIISENKLRFDKDIYTENKQGNGIGILSFSTEEEEVNWICERLKEALEKDNFGSIAILYRNNRSFSYLIDAMHRYKIPCNIYEKPFNPYDSAIFRDFIHYYNMSHNIDNISSRDFLPVMNKPVRYISRRCINSSNIDLTLLMGMNKDKEYIVRSIKKLVYDLKQMKGMDLFSAFHYFRKVIGYEEYVYKEMGENGKRNVAELFIIIQKMLINYKSLEEIEEYIRDFEERTEKKPEIEIADNNIYAMTYHASKGLEFDTVYLPKLMEGEIPSNKSVTDEDIEEERRMLYVAMTRAKENLNISFLKGNSREKKMISRFISVLLKDKG